LLVRRVFGSRSERLDRAQLPAIADTDTALTVVQALAVSVGRLRKERAQRLPENLSVVEEVIDPEPVKAAPQSWRCIGQEVSEQLDFEPARFLRRRLIRRKYVHHVDLDQSPVIAPLPECLQERRLAAPGLLAHVLVGKYCDHLPLYRQEQIFIRRHGVHLPRQTLARWVALAAD
jgi:transposase